MGLLDDAIREHLDLKRARGGDPAEIERMEREALGPVRRGPVLDSSPYETEPRHDPRAPETSHYEHVDGLEDLQEQGYHDSTAPHPHHPAHAELEDTYERGYPGRGHVESFDPEPAEAEPPRRRFLRRSRPVAPVDDLVEHHGLPELEDTYAGVPFDHPDATQGVDGLDHAAGSEREYEPDAGLEHEPGLAHQAPTAEHQAPMGEHERAQPELSADRAPSPPPHLQFEQPPKRPRFTADPPGLQTSGVPGFPDPEPLDPAVPEPPLEDVQETTEFDVESHIAATRFQAEPEPPVPGREPVSAPDASPGAEEEEDVLEETPEFLQDTPEHDRLWFEQRPPRDFDFDG